MRKVVLAPVVFVLALLATACPNGVEDVLPGENVLSISAHEYRFEAGDAEAGVITIAASNEGEELHHFLLARLADGTTEEDFQQWVDEGMEGEPDFLEEQAGGIEVLEPGGAARLTMDIPQEGTYAFICFLPAPDGRPHIALGMYQIVQLEGTSDAEFPEPDHTFAMSDDALDGPEEVGAGSVVLEVRNERTDEDAFFVAEFDEGAAGPDVDAWFQGGQEGPAPARFHGGAALPPGETIYYELELESGLTYTAIAGQGHTVEFTAT